MPDQHNKADAGKLRPALLIEGMPNALLAVAAVLSYGAEKYEDNGWKKVDPSRYKDAYYRHILAMGRGETHDDESGLLHDAHAICNALFMLELKLAGFNKRHRERQFVYNKPPRAHREDVQFGVRPINSERVHSLGVVGSDQSSSGVEQTGIMAQEHRQRVADFQEGYGA